MASTCRRFSPERIGLRDEFRANHRIPTDAVVIGFVGRLTRDKGVEELVRAFVAVPSATGESVLLLIGDYEHRDRPADDVIQNHRGASRLFVTSAFSPMSFPGMAAMDVVALPTHREGLGNVLLEAAALGLPTVTTDATGRSRCNRAWHYRHAGPVGDAEALS